MMMMQRQFACLVTILFSNYPETREMTTTHIMLLRCVSQFTRKLIPAGNRRIH